MAEERSWDAWKKSREKFERLNEPVYRRKKGALQRFIESIRKFLGF
ncbi:MAG: hypothetical protein QXP42_00315 [Candidatus Micrarchaeia archaeon]